MDENFAVVISWHCQPTDCDLLALATFGTRMGTDRNKMMTMAKNIMQTLRHVRTVEVVPMPKDKIG